MINMNSKNEVSEDCLAIAMKILWALWRRKMHVYMMLRTCWRRHLNSHFLWFPEL